MFKKVSKLPIRKNAFFPHSSTILVLSSIVALNSVLMSNEAFSEDVAVNSSPATAEDTKSSRRTRTIKSDDGLEEIVITGSKVNLMDAQAIKRDAETMVDAISAEEIGLLPDRSSLDAMQRLPGVAIERFASPNDPDHYSVEGSDIILRGMTQTRSEFNGRDSFSAHSGRGLSYRDIPPELLGSIQIFKNQTADMVEGGIGGTVNLVTRKPLDGDDREIHFSVDYSYGDLAEQWSPTFSGMYSQVFNSSVGKWGFLLNYVDSKLIGQSHGIQSEAYLTFYARDVVTENNPNPVGTRAEDFLGEDGDGIVWLPNAANLLMKEDERERNGFTAALQFESEDGSIKALAEFIRSDSTLAWNERSIKYQGGFFLERARPTAPLDGTHIVFDENGLFQAGVLAEEGNPWRVGRTGHSRVPTDGGREGYTQWGHKTQMDSRVNETHSVVEDFSLNLQIQATDRLLVETDFQYIDSTARVDDLSIHINTWAMFDFDVRGDLPQLRLIEPWNGERDATRANDDQPGGLDDNIFDVEESNRFYDPGFVADPLGDQNYFQDDDSYLWRSAMDHYERSEGDLLAWRLDVDYELDAGVFSKVKAGYRYSEREQVVRATSWNWGALAPEWHGQSPTNWDLPEGEFIGTGIGWLPDIPQLQDGYEFVDWSDFMHGGVVDIPGGQTIHANEALIRAVMGANPSRHLYQSRAGDSNWIPYPERDVAADKYQPLYEVPGNYLSNISLDSKYGIFAPDEINQTIETRDAVYVRLDFEGDDELKYSGNVGLRYLKMKRQADGVVDFPLIVPRQRELQRMAPESVSLPASAETVLEHLNQQVADGQYDGLDSAASAADNNWIYNPYFFIDSEVRGFAQGVPVLDEQGEQAVERNRLLFAQYVTPHRVVDEYDTWMPSLNVKVDLTSELVGRVAFAKAIAFPDMSTVRNRVEIAPIDVTSGSDSITITRQEVELEDAPALNLIDSVRVNQPEGGTYFVGEGGNPNIKPMESLQYDFSLEWYFSDYGQLSAAIFHKNLSNYFSRGVITREFTNGFSGVSQPVAITTDRNGGDAKLDGIEINYHQFFEGIFDGFGIQATYTYIDANGVPNNEKGVEEEQWYNSIYEDTGIRVDTSNLPLQGVSDQIVNFIAMYENESVSARLAYNWRSKYLLTTRDVISKAPQWYDDHGELDGSIFYRLDDHFTIGIQAENITNARSDIIMILNDELLEAGRSWFVSDRRVALVLRGEF